MTPTYFVRNRHGQRFPLVLVPRRLRGCILYEYEVPGCDAFTPISAEAVRHLLKDGTVVEMPYAGYDALVLPGIEPVALERTN